MKKVIVLQSRKIKCNESYVAEPLEIQLSNITTKGLEAGQSAPIIFTEKKDGVRPEFNIRTDKWEIAEQAMGAVNKTAIAKRNGESASESIQSTPANSENAE